MAEKFRRVTARTMLLCAAVVIGICANTAPADAQALKVEWAHQRLTIDAENVPLARILTEIARQTGSGVVGLENVSASLTINVRDARLLDVLRTLLTGVDCMIMQYSADTAADVRVRLRLCGPSHLVAAAPCVVITNAGRVHRAGCDDSDVRAVEEAVRTIATDRFPSGPSPAEAEAARLVATGFFNPGAPESSLLAAAKATDAGVRMMALQTLALQNTKAGSLAINEALDDTDPFVRSEALNLFLNLGGPPAEVVRRLGDLLTHNDPAVRFPAAMALGEQSGAEAEFHLKRALDNDDGVVRDMAAQLLQQKEQQKEKKKP